MYRLVSIAVMVFVLIGLVTGVWISHRHDLKSRGYCFTEKRFFSDIELSEIVVSHILQKLETDPPDLYDPKDREIYEYNSIEEFKRVNPTCCEDGVFRELKISKFERPGILKSTSIGGYGELRILGMQGVGIYKKGDRTDLGYFYDITPCGDILVGRFGVQLYPANPTNREARIKMSHEYGGQK